MNSENNLNFTTVDTELVGSGTPEGVRKGPIGTIYTDVGTGQRYVKTTGPSSTTGWGILGDIVIGTLTGTAYTLTATSAAIAGGTTSPSIVLPYKGRWLLEGLVSAQNAGATYAASRTLTFLMKRTNNTPATLSTLTAITGVTSTVTNMLFHGSLVPLLYDTSNTDDAIALYADVSTIASAGSSTINFAALKATYIGTQL